VTRDQAPIVPADPRAGDPVGAKQLNDSGVSPVAPFAKLSIFYPMWNEELYIERALAAGHRAGRRLIERGDIADYELIVVNDASTDRTGEIADRLAAADARVVAVHHPQNRKLGGAIKTGFAAATGDLILYTDADLPFDMAELPRAVRLMRDYDVDLVSAYRLDRTGEGYLRTVYTFWYNLLIRTMFGVKARDINFAFKLCRARLFDHVELRSEGSFIDAELVIRATRLGFEMLQFGVDYFPRTRGESTLSSPGVILKILREMRELRSDLDGIQPIRTD
jgi:glycosyltransferase involved in cell wall biosynthesis